MIFAPGTSPPEPFACALLVVAAFSVAGVAHTLWMRSGASAPFRVPLDGGLRWRGRRLLGDNKTLRGFMAIVPATGVAFAVLAAVRESLPAWLAAGWWTLPPAQSFLLGAWLGFWFMAGELPNSFLKRRLGIAPGAAPTRGFARAFCLVLDRVDSILAMMIALFAVAPVHPLTGLYVLLFGPAVHLLFSVLLWRVHVKARPA